MFIEVVQTHVPQDLRDTSCFACRGQFRRTVAEVLLMSDTRVCLGEVCPACLGRGPEHIEEQVRWQAFIARLAVDHARMEADHLEDAAAESLDECPSVEEFLMLEKAIGRPLYNSPEEADEAFNASLED